MATTHFLEYVTYFYDEVEACIVTYLLLVKPKHFCFDAHIATCLHMDERVVRRALTTLVADNLIEQSHDSPPMYTVAVNAYQVAFERMDHLVKCASKRWFSCRACKHLINFEDAALAMFQCPTHDEELDAIDVGDFAIIKNMHQNLKTTAAQTIEAESRDTASKTIEDDSDGSESAEEDFV